MSFSRHGFVLALLAFLLPATRAAATGPYMLGCFGGRQVSNQDMNDFFSMGNQVSAPFVPNYLGEAYLTAGYRFTDPFALEVAGGTQMGREESGLYSFGDVDLQVPSGALSLVSIAPLFCFDTFGSVTSSWMNQVGFRVEYAQISGTETMESAAGVSSLGFNGSTVGWGMFYRLVNLWAPARLSVGLEMGFDILKFTNLATGNASGVFVGEPGRTLENMNGASAFLDNSGPYLRLVIGWAKDSSSYMRSGSGVSDANGSYPSTEAARQASEAAVLARARAARNAGDNTAALECYRAYLHACPTDAAAWRELGQLYQHYGKQAFAKQCFDKADRLARK
jgi:hypothetical protein